MSGVAVLTVHHDDEARRALRAVVTGTPGFDHAGDAGSAEEALELALALRPDLALVAAQLPGIDGRETGERLRAAVPEIVVALLDDRGAETLTGASLRDLWERDGEE
jgi:two-component system, NarL family, nitrate/nitrite response regulator NarL